MIRYVVLCALLLFTLSTKAVASEAQDCLRLYYMKSYQQALPICQQAAELGYVQVQFTLAKMLLAGKGMKKDRRQAIYWLQEASRQGHAPARYQLQRMNAYYSDRERHRVASKPWSEANVGATPATTGATEAKPAKAIQAKKSMQPLAVETFSEPQSIERVRAEPIRRQVIRTIIIGQGKHDKQVKPVELKRVELKRAELKSIELKRIEAKPAPIQVLPKGGDRTANQELPSAWAYESLNSSETAEIGRIMAMDMAEDSDNQEDAE